MSEEMKPSVSLISLGCMKNLVDSESFLGKLALENFILHPDPLEADLLLINTCGFIKSARKEGYETIKFYVKERKKRGLKGILVFGCMVEREGKKLFNKLKNVNGFVGLSNYDIFKEATRCRLRSSFPVGSFLSGGLDSSSIVCMASGPLRNHDKDQLQTFSGIFDKVFVHCKNT